MACQEALSVYEEMFSLDPDGYKQLQSSQSHPAVSTHTCPAGERVVCVEKRRLHSGRDPKTEAKRFARSISSNGKELVVLLGYASGYVAQALQYRHESTILVFEPSIEILREGLPHLPPNADIKIITSANIIRNYIIGNGLLLADLALALWPPSARIQTKAFSKVKNVIVESLAESKITQNTMNVRSKYWQANYLENLKHLCRNPEFVRYKDTFSGYPAIICSAGPSLTKNAGLLKSLKGSCLIIAVNTAAKALATMGIEPHIVISVESLDISSQFEGIGWMNRCTAFLEMTGTPAAFDLPFGTIVPIAVQSATMTPFSNQLCPNLTMAAGYGVSNAAVALATRLGCGGLVLLGQDLSFTDGQVYAKGSSFDEIKATSKDGVVSFHNLSQKKKIWQTSEDPKLRSPKTSYPTTKRPAWGDPNKSMETTMAFSMFARWFEDAGKKLDQAGVWRVNATEGGIHIDNWPDQPLADAIEQYGLDQAPTTTQAHVRYRLQALAQLPAMPISKIIGELEREQKSLIRLLDMLETLQAWAHEETHVNLEPSARWIQTWEEVRRTIHGCHLLHGQIHRPLHVLMKRQELNALRLISFLENEIHQLRKSIDSVLETLQPDTTQSRAAS